MTTKEIYTTATLNEIFTEVNRRAQEGYIVADGPTYSEGTYTVTFKRGKADSAPEVVAPVKPNMPSPATEQPVPVPPLHPEDAEVEFELRELADPALEQPVPEKVSHPEKDAIGTPAEILPSPATEQPVPAPHNIDTNKAQRGPKPKKAVEKEAVKETA